MTTPYDTYKNAILGVPFDPNKQPSRQGAVKAFSEMQLQLEGAQSGALVKDTLANLEALTSVSEASIMAWVTSDNVQANNGIYENTGTAVAPSWTRRADIPQFVIAGINEGDGTANAIQVTTDLAIPVENARCLIMVPIVADNTGATTVSFNSSSVKTIKSISGSDVLAGSLLNGMVVTGYISDDEFRLVTDIASASIVTQAEAARDAALNVVHHNYQLRNQATADAIALLPNDAVVEVNGLTYQRDDVVPMLESAFGDFNVAGVKPFGVATLSHYGATGNGIDDDTVAVFRSIVSNFNRKLIWPEGVYKITSQQGGLTFGELQMSGFVDWRCENAKITFNPAAHVEGIFGFETGGHDFKISGNLQIDLQNMGATAIHVRNSSISMSGSNIGEAMLTSVHVSNSRMIASNHPAYPLSFRGGFSDVILDNICVNGARINSTIASGHVGAAGVVIYPNGSGDAQKNAYSQKILITGGHIANVGHDDPTIQIDMDGIRAFGPELTASDVGVSVSSLRIDGMTFENCSTRSIKSKMRDTNVTNCKIIRTTQPTNGILGPEIDCQHAGATITNNTFLYENVSINTVVGATMNGNVEDDHLGFTAKGNKILHTGTGGVSYPFAQYGNSVGVPFLDISSNVVQAAVVSLLNLHFLGSSAFASVTSNFVKSLSTSLIRATGNGGFAQVTTVGNINGGTDVPISVDSIPNAGASVAVSGFSNSGFDGPIDQADGTNQRSPVLRGSVLGPVTILPDNNYATAGIETVSIVDDAVHAFKKRSFDNVGVYLMMVNNYSERATALFSVGTAGSVTLGAGDLIEVGGTSNPDVDGRTNIWLDTATGQINVKNRIGSTRYFTLFHIA